MAEREQRSTKDGTGKAEWFYKDDTGKVFGSYGVAQMEYWTKNGYFGKDTMVSRSRDEGFRTISDLGAGGFRAAPHRNGEYPEKKKASDHMPNIRDKRLDPTPILRSTSWTRPERLERRSEDASGVCRKMQSEIETWIESRKIKIERELKASTGTNIILQERSDPSSRRFEMLVGRKKIPVVLHHPEVFQSGRAGQFLLRALDSAEESRKLCDAVNDFARRNCFNILGHSVSALLGEIVRVYESMFAKEERFERFREIHGFAPAESPTPSTPTKRDTDELSDIAAGRSLARLATKRTRTVDAFKRTWAREEEGDGRRRRRPSSKFVSNNSFLDEIDRAASPDAATLLRLTKRRLLKELEHVFKNTSSSQGVDVDIVDGSPFHWRVILSSFDPSSLFAKDLDAHAKKHKLADAQARLDIRFPAEFPNRPPEVRLVRPILRMYTAESCSGAFALPRLRREGWEPGERVLEMIMEIKKTLETSGRVEIDANAVYPRPAFEAALSRINARTKDAFENAHSIEGTFFMYSGSIARNVMHMKIPETFESGNKVLLPGNLLEKLHSSGGRGAFNRSSSSDETTSGFASIMGGGGLVFEITTPMGISTFCGVLQFNAPESNLIVAPDWMIKNMFATDGMEVQLRSVELPKLTFLKVQPRKADWSTLVAQTGMDPQTFMQTALQRYVSLSKGDAISLSAFGEEMPFTVIEIKPNVPAGRLFDGFFAEVAFDVAKPLLEEETTESSSKISQDRASGALAKTLSAQERERREANERFERKWREEQEQIRRTNRLKTTVGVPVDDFDESKGEIWRLRLRTYDGSNFIARCNALTTCDKLHSLLQKEAPTGRVPYTLVQEGGTSASIPNESGKTIRDVGISDEVILTQRLKTSGLCDACIAKRPFVVDNEEKEGRNENKNDEMTRATCPRMATKAHIFGRPKDVVRLCDLHRCKWLEEMLQFRALEQDENEFLSKDFVLGCLGARLI